MRNALLDLQMLIIDYIGNSKVILLFLCSVLYVFYDNNINETKRRRFNPTVFLLSVWSGIAYAFTICIKKQKAIVNTILVSLLILVATSMAGGFVFTEEAIKESIYYYNPPRMWIIAGCAIISFFVIYFLISTELFKNISERLIFVLCALILHLFAFYTVKSLEVSVFLNPLSIGSIVLHDFMPFGLWILLSKIGDAETERKRTEEAQAEIHDKLEINEQDEDYQEEWDLKKHKILNMRNMTIAFVLLLVAFISSVFVLNSKINNLYNVTVALEKATEDKVSFYEFKKKGSEKVLATMSISGEGTVTVTGGGETENGIELYRFITSRAQKVDKWYIEKNESNDEDSNIDIMENETLTGALNYCVSQGLTVDNVYIVTGVEQIGGNN